MPYLQQRLQLLRLPNFRWFVLSCLFGSFGAGLTHIVVSWLVLQTHNSVTGITISMVAFWLPNVLLGPYMGVFVDRYSRAKCIVISTTIRGMVLLIFALLYWHAFTANGIYLLCFISGLFFSLYFPAVMGFVREIVAPDQLLYANATVDLAYEIGNVLGMGSAGFLMAWFSPTTVILINGWLFFISALLVAQVSIPSRKSNQTTHRLYQEFKEGLSYLLANKKLLTIYSVQILIMSQFMTAPVLLAPFAKNILHTNVIQFGTIEAALSVGIVLGGIFMPWLANRYGHINSLIFMLAMLCMLFSLFGINRQISYARVIYFLIGFCISVWPLLITKAQELTDLHYQGRVQSCFNSVSGALILLVYLLVNFSNRFLSISELYGLETFFTMAALLLLYQCRKLFMVGRVSV